MVGGCWGLSFSQLYGAGRRAQLKPWVLGSCLDFTPEPQIGGPVGAVPWQVVTEAHPCLLASTGESSPAQPLVLFLGCALS